jgi:hypothetical protein
MDTFTKMLKEMEETRLSLMKKNTKIRDLTDILSAINDWYEKENSIKEIPLMHKDMVDLLFMRAKQVLEDK